MTKTTEVLSELTDAEKAHLFAVLADPNATRLARNLALRDLARNAERYGTPITTC